MRKQNLYGLRTIAIATLLSVMISGCSEPSTAPKTAEKIQKQPKQTKVQETKQELPKRISAKVVEVIDGDTVKVNLQGKKETVRFLLIDTPETKHPEKPVQPFGREAAAFTKELLSGKQVELEKDISERDRYGRLLCYVYVNGKSVQEIILEKGLARVAVFPPDVKYVDQYRAIQDKARKAGVGIWSVENYAQKP